MWEPIILSVAAVVATTMQQPAVQVQVLLWLFLAFRSFSQIARSSSCLQSHFLGDTMQGLKHNYDTELMLSEALLPSRDIGFIECLLEFACV